MPYDATADVADQIIESCEKHLNAFRNDCSGFARTVAADFGITLVGDANHLAEVLETRWLSASDAREAGRLAGLGKFVIAAKAEPKGRHGHVAIIVKGPRSHGEYPLGYWGSLGGTAGRKIAITRAWTKAALPDVKYFYTGISGLVS